MSVHKNRWMSGLAGVVLLALTVSNSFAQADGGALQMKLDRPVKLTLSDEPIRKIFQKLSRATLIDFEISPDTLELLPYGSETRLNVTIPDVTLRSALSQILSPQALNWEVASQGQKVLVVPSEPLYRMCRRATYDEMLLLGKIISTPVEALDKHQSVVGTLRKAVGEKDIKVIFPASMSKADLAVSFRQARDALPCPTAEWLGLILRPVGLTWYLDGSTVMVLGWESQIKRQMNRVVSLRYQNARLSNVLLDLARKGRVKVTMTPGVMKILPKSVRSNFTLIMADATIAQALEVISGATGLEFPITNDGFLVKTSLYLEVSTERPTGRATRRKRPRYMIKTTLQKIAGQTVDLYIRPDEMPEDLRKALDLERDKILSQLAEKFSPAEEKTPSEKKK